MRERVSDIFLVKLHSIIKNCAAKSLQQEIPGIDKRHQRQSVSLEVIRIRVQGTCKGILRKISSPAGTCGLVIQPCQALRFLIPENYLFTITHCEIPFSVTHNQSYGCKLRSIGVELWSFQRSNFTSQMHDRPDPARVPRTSWDSC